MNLSDLTPEQLKQALYHFRGAVLARTQQWDHERKIELLLGEREIELNIEDIAGCVDGDSFDMTPDDLVGIIDLDELVAAIPEETE